MLKSRAIPQSNLIVKISLRIGLIIFFVLDFGLLFFPDFLEVGFLVAILFVYFLYNDFVSKVC